MERVRRVRKNITYRWKTEDVRFCVGLEDHETGMGKSGKHLIREF